MLPDFLVADAVSAGKLEVVMPNHKTTSSLWAVYPHSRHLSAKVRLFIDLMLEAFSPEPPWKCVD